ncbi:unnamed protein product [Hydatigera taeniaeformis]|uniref:Uncharacterized protein n=1 Tax=Hydatigena taeniaeformis TaxID=6205 RepID=A0A0R3WLZ2_HYDTA|nr:unnamed protein product [Hydatigera taeniaeformis]
MRCSSLTFVGPSETGRRWTESKRHGLFLLDHSPRSGWKAMPHQMLDYSWCPGPRDLKKQGKKGPSHFVYKIPHCNLGSSKTWINRNQYFPAYVAPLKDEVAVESCFDSTSERLCQCDSVAPINGLCLVWQTDLSFIFPILSPKDVIQSTRLRYPNLATKLASSGLLPTRLTGSDLLAVQPPTLGGIGQLPQTKQQENAVAELKSAILQHSSGIRTTYTEKVGRGGVIAFRSPSPEIINFFLALAFLAIRIATTFWTVWPTFSYLTSILLVCTGVYLTVEYTAVSLLVQLTACLTAHINSTNVYGALIMVRLPMRLSSWQMILLTVIGYFITLSSYGVLFHLGVRQFYKAIQKNYYTVVNVLRFTKGPVNGASEMTVTPTPCSETPPMNASRGSGRYHFWPLQGRVLIALGFISLVVSILIRVPCLYDIFLLYWNEKDYLCLTTVALFICIHLAWLIMWLGFAMKQKWNFRMFYPRMMPPCLDTNPQSTFITEPGVQSHLAYTPVQECNEEVSLTLPNQTFFSPLQIQNPGISVHGAICLPSAQLHTATNSLKYPPRTPTPQEIIGGQMMTNKFYESNSITQSVGTPAGEMISLQGHYLLSPTTQKYTSIRRLNSWEPEVTEAKQKVIVSVTETGLPNQLLRGPRTISCETARSSDTHPQSMLLQPIEEGINGGEGSTLMKLAPVAMQESGRSTASSADQICSQV